MVLDRPQAPVGHPLQSAKAVGRLRALRRALPLFCVPREPPSNFVQSPSASGHWRRWTTSSLAKVLPTALVGVR